MSRFYGSLKGERKTTNTKMAQRELTGHLRTWDHGIEVVYKQDYEHITCEVWETGGSNNPQRIKRIRTFKIPHEKAPNYRPGHGPGKTGGIGNEVRRAST